jgi:hypothetical protein
MSGEMDGVNEQRRINRVDDAKKRPGFSEHRLFRRAQWLQGSKSWSECVVGVVGGN